MGQLKVSERLLDNYDGFYEDGESEWRRLGALDKAENIVSLCAEVSIDSVIEIGAGDGSIVQRLSDLSFAPDLYAIDISRSSIETIARRQIPGLRECSIFDGYAIPYPDKRFDLAVLSHVVEHAEHPRKLITEASRVARHLFVEVPLECNWRLPDDFVPDEVGHINYYSPKLIRHLLQTCDLEVLGERVSNPTKAVYEFNSGKKARAKYYVKEYLLRALPSLATQMFTYHASMLCRDKQNP